MDAQPSHALLQPYRPTDADPFDAVKAAHLLNRAGFGGTSYEVGKVLQLGPTKAVDWLMDFKDVGAEKQGTDKPDLASIDGYNADYKEIIRQTAGKTEQEKMELRMKFRQANEEAIRATIAWWLRRMTYGPHPLQEKLTLFWHGHFTTSDKDERQAAFMWTQNELLRQNAAGNFRTFVRAISRDPAMLDYLNNNSNRKQHPNENYARELMELFTLGIGNYSEQDVKEGARAFTGWAHDAGDFIFRKGLHDDGTKTFLGVTGNLNGDDAIDVILSKPACGKFIAGKLFRYFAHDDPDDSVVGALGRQLQQNRYEIRPTVRTILTSRAFYSPIAVGSQIKSPIQLMLGVIRQVGLEMPPDGGLLFALKEMGQVPFQPPNVRGWPGGRMWINTSTLLARYNTATRLLDGRLPRADGSRLSDDLDTADPKKVVDHWLACLVQRPVADDKKAVLAATLAKGRNREDGVRQMVQLIVAMPEYQLC
jgi:uncharacterized protein (DUF1800 family)